MHYEIRPQGSDAVFRVEGAPSAPFETGTQVVMAFRPEDTLAIARS